MRTQTFQTKKYLYIFLFRMSTKRGPSPPQSYKYPGNNSSDTIEEFSSTASPSPPSLKNLKRVLLQFKRAARGVNNAAPPQPKKRKKKKSKEIVIKFKEEQTACSIHNFIAILHDATYEKPNTKICISFSYLFPRHLRISLGPSGRPR